MSTRKNENREGGRDGANLNKMDSSCFSETPRPNAREPPCSSFHYADIPLITPEGQPALL